LIRCAWVFAGGDCIADKASFARITDADIIIGVDRGIEHCLNLELVPELLIGDFDSVNRVVLQDERLAQSQIIRHPSRKDHSDLELALCWLEGAGVETAVLFGVSGGRSDHHLFNWLLPMQKHWPFSIQLVDESVHAYLVSAHRPMSFSAQIGQTISLLPLPSAEGVSTNGLEYALHNAAIAPGSTLGLSNIAVANTVNVEISAGQLLVFSVNLAIDQPDLSHE